MVDTETLTKYKCILASFMSFLHNCAVGSEYPRDHVHAIEVLTAVTPNDVLRYLNLKTFGTKEHAGDANPISAHANSLAMDKKAMLYFMPNCNVWSGTRSEGNPTRSVLVNALFKRVTKKEARKQEVDLQSRRPMLGQEFVVMHDLLNWYVLSVGRRGEGVHDVFWKRREEVKGEDDGDGAATELSLLGSYSIRKYAAKFAQRCGVIKQGRERYQRSMEGSR